MEQAVQPTIRPVMAPPLKRPWRDYSGRVSPLKAVVFTLLFVPVVLIAYNYAAGNLGARPLLEAQHELGDWTIRFIFLALAVTPLTRLLQWPRLMLVRRMIGVAAFAYIMSHFALYALEEMLNWLKIASEIVLRIYLTIGFAALLGLAALAATSTDAMVRRMGARNWQRLHRLVYLIAALAVIHYFMQSKLDEWQPTIMLGLYLWLMGYRLAAARLKGKPMALWAVAALSLAAGVLTAGFEIGYFALWMHVPVMRIIPAELSTMAGVRPAWVVLAITLGVTLAAGAVRLTKRRSQLKPA